MPGHQILYHIVIYLRERELALFVYMVKIIAEKNKAKEFPLILQTYKKNR